MKKIQLLHTILIENDIQVHVIVSKKKLWPDRLLKMEDRDTCKPSNSYVSFNFHLCLPPPPRHHIC